MNRNSIIALAATVLVLLLLGCMKSNEQAGRELDATIWAESQRTQATATASVVQATVTAEAKATAEALRVHELEIEKQRIEAAAELVEEQADAYVKQKNADTLDYMVKSGEKRQDTMLDHIMDESKPGFGKNLIIIALLGCVLAVVWWLYSVKFWLESPEPEDTEFEL